MSRAPASTTLFRSDRVARFRDRPNRYLVRAISAGRSVEAYCPNPGRMFELLEPGTELYLERTPAVTQGRRTRYTLGACRHPRDGHVVPLYATRSNTLAGELVIPSLVPGARSIRPEAKLGDSRIDFAVETPGRPPVYIEVKTCTLVEHGVAMFPDAPTTRGLRHVEELAALRRSGAGEGHVLFVLMSPHARRMVPNVHTDPAFAFGLERLSREVDLHAVAVAATPQGKARVVRVVPVDLDPIRRLVAAGMRADTVGGGYLLVLGLERRRCLEVGALGEQVFERGRYVYVGSAVSGLAARVTRHLARRKKIHWHIDYLRAAADSIEAWPVVCDRRIECALATDVAALAEPWVDGFGSSDCGCRTHLYRLPPGPAGRAALLSVVLKWRHRLALEAVP